MKNLKFSSRRLFLTLVLMLLLLIMFSSILYQDDKCSLIDLATLRGYVASEIRICTLELILLSLLSISYFWLGKNKLRIGRERLLTCIWIAPVTDGYLNDDPKFRCLGSSKAWFPKHLQSQLNDSEKHNIAIHLFPDGLRLYYFCTAIVWLLSCMALDVFSYKKANATDFSSIITAFKNTYLEDSTQWLGIVAYLCLFILAIDMVRRVQKRILQIWKYSNHLFTIFSVIRRIQKKLLQIWKYSTHVFMRFRFIRRIQEKLLQIWKCSTHVIMRFRFTRRIQEKLLQIWGYLNTISTIFSINTFVANVFIIAAIISTIFFLDYNWEQRGLSVFIAVAGFIFFWLILPLVIYVIFRRPVWENVNDHIPGLVVSHVNHSFQEHIIHRYHVYTAFLKRNLLPFDGEEEPIYWQNIPSRQEQMINISMSTLILNAFYGKKSRWAIYVLFFFFGAPIFFYLGLWGLALLDKYNPLILGFIALGWAIISIHYTIKFINIIFKKRWSFGSIDTLRLPSRANDEYLSLKHDFKDWIETDSRILTINGSINFIFAILLISFLTFTAL